MRNARRRRSISRVAALRDLDAAELEAGRGGMDETLHARARHVVSEIGRVAPFAAALASGDAAALARLLEAGHRSLAGDFGVSLPALDQLAAEVQSALGDAGGVRLTGAGFGGCLVAVSDAAAAPAIAAAVEGHNREAENPAPDRSVPACGRGCPDLVLEGQIACGGGQAGQSIDILSAPASHR